MQMDFSVLEQMPFPYFIINDDYKIVFSSKTTNQYFLPTDSFNSLIEKSQIDLLRDFLSSEKQQVVELKMHVYNKQLELFHLYKQKAKDAVIHLFCIPKEPYSSEVNDMLVQVENKLSTIQNDFTANKELVAKTVLEAQEAAFHSEQLATIGQLAAGVAHEIRNPLTTVKGFIQLIKPYLSDVGKEDYATIALDEINRANDIIHEFLNTAKPQKNKKQIIEVNKLMRDIMVLYESEAILRNINIEVIGNCNQAQLYLDIKQIKQVLVNIIKNALEAIEENQSLEKGCIQISSECSNSAAVIVINDNGIGMKKETLEKLFDPFFSTKEYGTGIGMTVCKKIIEEHMGQIKVSSTPYLGTTFRIELPIYQEAFSKSN
jgi:signal transduction histidine kinase